MSTPSQVPPTVFIIDDDESVCRYLSRLVRHSGMEPRTFSCAQSFLSARKAPMLHPSCLVLDLQIPGLGGLELQRQLASEPAHCPVIFISGHGDIPSSVKAMKQGAVTFLPKPFENRDLLQAIHDALDRHRAVLNSLHHVLLAREHIRRLTGREREVMSWVITGALNKQIAGELGIAQQTVKLHRGRMMEKMGVTSVAELVRLCETASFAQADATKVQ